MHFLVGSKRVIFGIGEFSLVTDLNSGVLPSEVDIKEKASLRRIMIYFNNNEIMESSTLETSFSDCMVEDDIWKLNFFVFVFVC